MKRKISLPKGFNNQEFFNLVSSCLKRNNELKELKKSYDEHQNKYDLDIYDGMYSLSIKGQNECVFFTLTKIIENAEYTISLVFEKINEIRNLYISCESIGGTIEYKRIPPFMIDILRVIASRDFCKSTLGDTISVIYADESNKEEIISRINNYDDNIPMVLASQYFDTPAYEINENELAKNLTCFAYVVVADCAFMRSIKNQIQLKSYNGTVTVLTKEQIKSFRKEDMYRGVETTPLVFDYINKYSQSISLPKFVVKESTITIKPQDNKKENQEELQELKNQLEEANQKIKNLEKALEQAMDKKFGIILPKEIYDGEVLDLISCAVEDYIQNADDVQTRIKQLGKKILDLNPRGTNGKEFFEKVYSIVSKDGNLNSVQKSQLKALGFQETRKNGHHIFEIEGIPFTFSSSSSDFRNGKKINNTIKRTLCVYR